MAHDRSEQVDNGAVNTNRVFGAIWGLGSTTSSGSCEGLVPTHELAYDRQSIKPIHLSTYFHPLIHRFRAPLSLPALPLASLLPASSGEVWRRGRRAFESSIIHPAR